MASQSSATDSFTTCDLFDEHGDNAAVIGSELLDFGGRSSFAGSAVTVKCYEDNSAVRATLGQVGTGKILMVDGGGSTRCALLGDILAKMAIENGWEGIIVDGYVRDRAVLATLPIGIKARGTTPRKSHKFGEGQVDLEVVLCGAHVRPGNAVFADVDGVVILPAGVDDEG